MRADIECIVTLCGCLFANPNEHGGAVRILAFGPCARRKVHLHYVAPPIAAHVIPHRAADDELRRRMQKNELDGQVLITSMPKFWRPFKTYRLAFLLDPNEWLSNLASVSEDGR
jgi:hypothetical protein